MAPPHDHPNDYRPVGFCPYCDHAIDPGVCPECGESVTSAKLRRRPRSAIWRRRRRRIVVAVLLVGAFFGGRWVYHRVDWVSQMPTWVLLLTQGGKHDATTIELVRRFEAGRLSDRAAQRLFEQALLISNKPWVISPRPAGYPIELSLEFEFLLYSPSISSIFPPGPSWGIVVEGDIVSVDGASATRSEGSWIWRHFDWVRPSRFLEATLPPIAPGRHEVVLRGQIIPYCDDIDRPDRRIRYPAVRIEVAATVDVLSEPIERFVDMVWSPAVSGEVERSIVAKLQISSDDEPLSLCVRNYYCDVMVAADLNIRSCAGGEVIYTSTYVEGRSDWYQMPDTASWRVGDEWTMELIPNPRLCLETGRQECFGGVITWTDLVAEPDTYVICEPNVPPTSIVPAEGLRLVPPRSED
ncbi:MAG: hypothetical protein IIB61_07035 [Planctomycetes bacterium]|nr:hypothetical protein [Planctomycetota bacterium]